MTSGSGVRQAAARLRSPGALSRLQARESEATVDDCLYGDESLIVPQRTDHEAFDRGRLGFCAAMIPTRWLKRWPQLSHAAQQNFITRSTIRGTSSVRGHSCAIG